MGNPEEGNGGEEAAEERMGVSQTEGLGFGVEG